MCLTRIFSGGWDMARRAWVVALLCSVSTAVLGQTTVYRFSKAFITSHYTKGSPIGILAASASSPAKNVHRISCGGNDGELHIGVEGAAIDSQGAAVSGPADGS